MSMYGAYPKILVDGKWVEQKARPVVDCSKDPLLTVQSEKDQADVNKIIARFEKTGLINHVTKVNPFYGDVSQFEGLADALIKVQAADELFMEMPANIRERFDNDKVKFVEFLGDEANRAEAIELGIIAKPVVTEGAPATPPVVPEQPA